MQTTSIIWRLLLICLLIVFVTVGHTKEEEETRFYFVQVTDTHFGDGDHLKRTKEIVKEINQLPMPITCVVHTGDITMDSIEKKRIVDAGRKIMEKLIPPLHYVAGNHDILSSKPDITRRLYVKHYGQLIAQAAYEDVVFIFIYTEPIRKGFAIEGYQPLNMLEASLRDAGGKPVIVFHHAPSVKDFYKNRFHKGWNSEIRDKWITLLNDYNVKAVIAGHFHRDELHWLGDVPLYVCPPVAGYWGRQASFRIYEYNNGKIGYRTQYID